MCNKREVQEVSVLKAGILYVKSRKVGPSKRIQLRAISGSVL